MCNFYKQICLHTTKDLSLTGFLIKIGGVAMIGKTIEKLLACYSCILSTESDVCSDLSQSELDVSLDEEYM